MGKDNSNPKDDLRIIENSIKELLRLETVEKKIHKAERKEVSKVESVLMRYCDTEALKEKMAKDEEILTLILQAKDVFASLKARLRD